MIGRETLAILPLEGAEAGVTFATVDVVSVAASVVAAGSVASVVVSVAASVVAAGSVASAVVSTAGSVATVV